MARKSSPHILDIVKLTIVFSIVLGIVVFSFALRQGWNKIGFAGAQTPEPAFCPEIYSPVCGTDGQTYSNGCFSGNANVTIACNGKCPCGDGDSFELSPPIVY